MNIYFYTFGCKVNSFESSAMAGLMRERGHAVCQSEETADAVVVNSCTVTASGDAKVRRYLNGLKRERPELITVLTGCFPQAYPEAAAGFACADIVTGTGDRARLPELIERFAAERTRIVEIQGGGKKAFENLSAAEHDGHTRAFLKIEDGCDRFCAYCVIPYARGNVRSMALDELKKQAASLARNGYREIVLTGINLSYFGREAGLSLADAVAAVNDIEGVARIRLGSLEPDLLSESTIEKLSRCGKLCPQFHMSLQSGCDHTLSRMKRRYTAAGYAGVAAALRSAFDRPTFTTDVIVGFPGETDAEFSESLAFVESFGFLKVHVFPYSRRPGTAAYDMPNQVEKREKTRRAALMSEAAEKGRTAVMQSFVGSPARVILEAEQSGAFSGYTDRYLPAAVRLPGARSGDVITGTIERIENGLCAIKRADYVL